MPAPAKFTLQRAAARPLRPQGNIDRKTHHDVFDSWREMRACARVQVYRGRCARLVKSRAHRRHASTCVPACTPLPTETEHPRHAHVPRPSRPTTETWLILPVGIRLSQRLSHACPSISTYTVKLRMAHYISNNLFDSPFYSDIRSNSRVNTCTSPATGAFIRSQPALRVFGES